MKTDVKVAIFVGMVGAIIFTIFFTYLVAHWNGYRDALREIPLYYEVTGEHPNLEWAESASRRTLVSEEDILDMLYPYGR